MRKKINTWWEGKNPILKFAFGFALLMGAFYSIWLTPFFLNSILTPVVRLNAWVSAKILGVFGYHPSVVDSTLISPSISLNVSVGCDALEPMAIYSFSVILFPAAFRTKLIGFCAGMPALFILNQLRIITLYVIGAHSDTLFGIKKEFYFNLIHLQVWPVIFILATLLLLGWWILLSLRYRNRQLNPAT